MVVDLVRRFDVTRHGNYANIRSLDPVTQEGLRTYVKKPSCMLTLPAIASDQG